MALSQAAVEVKPGSKVKASVAAYSLDVDHIRAGRAGQDRQFDGLVAEGQGRRTGGFGGFSHQAPLLSCLARTGSPGPRLLCSFT